MSKQVVLLRVGIDAGCGGIQGPLFKDGTFDFVCIPDNKGVSVHTYGNMVGRNGNAHVGYFPESRRSVMTEQHVHADPEWETFTYGDPTPPKRSLRHLKAGDLLVFYCGLQEWDAESGWNRDHRPALYLAGYFEVALAGMAGDFEKRVLASEFGQNFHVRYPTVIRQQKDDLVLVKGGAGSRMFQKAHRISAEGKDRAVKQLRSLANKLDRMRRLKPGGIAAFETDYPDIAGKLDAVRQRFWRAGVFIVPVGELESWLSVEFMKDGPSKERKQEWADEAASRIRLRPEEAGPISGFVKQVASFLAEREIQSV